MAKSTEATVHFNGNDYAVYLTDGGEHRVFVIIHRKAVSRLGNYQQDTVFRTIKPQSQNWQRAVRLARKAVEVG